MEKRGGKASSLSETMSSTLWEVSLCCPEATNMGMGNLWDAQKQAGHVVSLASPWGAMGIAGCWETQECLQNCRPMSGNVGL